MTTAPEQNRPENDGPTEGSSAAAPKKKRRVPWGLIILFLIVGAGAFSCVVGIFGGLVATAISLVIGLSVLRESIRKFL